MRSVNSKRDKGLDVEYLVTYWHGKQSWLEHSAIPDFLLDNFLQSGKPSKRRISKVKDCFQASPGGLRKKRAKPQIRSGAIPAPSMPKSPFEPDLPADNFSQGEAVDQIGSLTDSANQSADLKAARDTVVSQVQAQLSKLKQIESFVCKDDRLTKFVSKTLKLKEICNTLRQSAARRSKKATIDDATREATDIDTEVTKLISSILVIDPHGGAQLIN